MKEIELETQKERERRERNETLCCEFQKLCKEHLPKGRTPNRIVGVLAKKYNMTTSGVLYILRGAGLYTGAEELIKAVQNTEAELYNL